MDKNGTSAPQDFAEHIKLGFQATGVPKIAELWQTIREWFEGGHTTDVAELHDAMDVPAFVASLKSMPHDITELIKAADNTASATSALVHTSSPTSHSPQASGSSLQPHSSSSGSLASSTLKSAVVNKMKEDFRKHFQAFKGTPWTLPSTAVVDDLLANYTETLRKESPLHSFVIDDVNTLLDQVADEGDMEVINKVLVMRSGEDPPMLSSEESAFIGLFNRKPEELEEFLSNGRGNAQLTSGNLSKEFTKRAWFAMDQIHFV
ncbi:hypothetical protein DFQ27_006833, partial [Actinomortierella ambigua]